ncbi:hypothetical protein V8B97DRAFT_1878491 [Scleroderma yunnanense]
MIPLDLLPSPSPLEKPSSPPEHQCSRSISCTVLSQIGKQYHTFPKGTFHACFIPPGVPHSILHHLAAHPQT